MRAAVEEITFRALATAERVASYGEILVLAALTSKA